MQVLFKDLNELFRTLLKKELEGFDGTQIEFSDAINRDPVSLNRWIVHKQPARKSTVFQVLKQLGYNIVQTNDGFTYNKNAKKEVSNSYSTTTNLLEKVEQVLLEMVEEATPEERNVISKCAIKLQGELTKWALENRVPKGD